MSAITRWGAASAGARRAALRESGSTVSAGWLATHVVAPDGRDRIPLADAVTLRAEGFPYSGGAKMTDLTRRG